MVEGQTKVGIKSHVQIRLLDEMPVKVRYIAGAANDHDFLKHIVLEKNVNPLK